MAPTIVQKPKAQVVDEGTSVTFDCTVKANPKPEVQCQHQNLKNYKLFYQHHIIFREYMYTKPWFLETIPVPRNICKTFVQCWSNVEDVGPMLYKCYTNVLCLLEWQNENNVHDIYILPILKIILFLNLSIIIHYLIKIKQHLNFK